MLILRKLYFGIFLTFLISTSVIADQQIQENNKNTSAVVCQPCDPIPVARSTTKKSLTPTHSIINNVFNNCDQSRTSCFDCVTSVCSRGAKRIQTPPVFTKGQGLFDRIDWVDLITKLVASLAWPLTVLIVLCLFRKPLLKLLPKLLKLKYKDLELSFDKELEEAKKEAETTDLPKVDEFVDSSLIAEKFNRFCGLAQSFPRAAIFEAWKEVEESIKNALYDRSITTKYEKVDGAAYSSAKKLFEGTSQWSCFNLLLDLKNKALRTSEDEFEINNEKAVSFVELALRLVAYVEKEWSPQNDTFRKIEPSEVVCNETMDWSKKSRSTYDLDDVNARYKAVKNRNKRKNVSVNSSMGKWNFKARLQLLNSGKEYYLDYLRNLTPQILLLTVIWLGGAKFSFLHFDISNLFSTLVFFAVVISFLLALYANWTRLNDRCFAELKKWEAKQLKRLDVEGIKGYHRRIAIARAVFRDRLIEYIEYIVLMFVVQVTLAIVIVMSINSATRILTENHRAANLVSIKSR